MVRVPSEISLEWLLGEQDPEHCSNPLTELSGADVDRLIRQCAAALRSHRNDFQHGRDRENALAAFSATITILLEVRDLHHPKLADIDQLLMRFGHPVPAN